LQVKKKDDSKMAELEEEVAKLANRNNAYRKERDSVSVTTLESVVQCFFLTTLLYLRPCIMSKS
jgi:hypothetical protein